LHEVVDSAANNPSMSLLLTFILRTIKKRVMTEKEKKYYLFEMKSTYQDAMAI
jgi:hypothetical protein